MHQYPWIPSGQWAGPVQYTEIFGAGASLMSSQSESSQREETMLLERVGQSR